jgi:hypothetical protein
MNTSFLIGPFMLIDLALFQQLFSEKYNVNLCMFHSMGILIPFSFGDLGFQKKRYMEASSGNLPTFEKLASK